MIAENITIKYRKTVYKKAVFLAVAALFLLAFGSESAIGVQCQSQCAASADGADWQYKIKQATCYESNPGTCTQWQAADCTGTTTTDGCCYNLAYCDPSNPTSYKCENNVCREVCTTAADCGASGCSYDILNAVYQINAWSCTNNLCYASVEYCTKPPTCDNYEELCSYGYCTAQEPWCHYTCEINPTYCSGLSSCVEYSKGTNAYYYPYVCQDTDTCASSQGQSITNCCGADIGQRCCTGCCSGNSCLPSSSETASSSTKCDRCDNDCDSLMDEADGSSYSGTACNCDGVNCPANECFFDAFSGEISYQSGGYCAWGDCAYPNSQFCGDVNLGYGCSDATGCIDLCTGINCNLKDGYYCEGSIKNQYDYWDCRIKTQYSDTYNPTCNLRTLLLPSEDCSLNKCDSGVRYYNGGCSGTGPNAYCSYQQENCIAKTGWYGSLLCKSDDGISYDVWQKWRDYSCSPSACTYIEYEVLRDACEYGCKDGQCYNPCENIDCNVKDGYYCNGNTKEYRDYAACTAQNTGCLLYTPTESINCLSNVCVGDIFRSGTSCSNRECQYTDKDCNTMNYNDAPEYYCKNGNLWQHTLHHDFACSTASPTGCIESSSYYINDYISEDCDDSFCNKETCNAQAGACVYTPPDCSYLGDSCNAGGCDIAAGMCVKIADSTKNGQSCSDYSICTANDQCMNGACQGTAVSCNDGLSCTNDYCAEGEGCKHDIAPGYCLIGGNCYSSGQTNLDCQICNPAVNKNYWTSDNSLCQNKCQGDYRLSGGSCSSGICQYSSSEDCSADICLNTVNIKYGDSCIAGFCTSTNMPCNDNIGCTSDSCNMNLNRCEYSTASCACSSNADCNDNNQCTDDVCDLTTRSCTNFIDNTNSCNDGLSCTLNDYCSDGLCKGTQKGCLDSYSCTDDICDEELGCVHMPNNAKCNTGEICNPILFPATGCGTFTNCIGRQDGAVCDDGNYCNGYDNCQNQVCVNIGTPVDCSGLNSQCSIGQCDEAKEKCITTPTNEGQLCNDNKWCTKDEVCASGECSGVLKTTECSDSIDCTQDSCNLATDQCAHDSSSCGCLDDSGCTSYCGSNENNVLFVNGSCINNQCSYKTEDCGRAFCSAQKKKSYDGRCVPGYCLYSSETCNLGCENGMCIGQCTSTAEVCDNIDNDCDGYIDEELTRSCGSNNTGECKPGIQVCVNGNWGTCLGEVKAKQEICGNGLDEDCDEMPDNGCFCQEGSTQQCGADSCSGQQTCTNNQWGNCNSENKDCGICCSCRGGRESYDNSQNKDCTSTACLREPECGAGNCGENIFGSYLPVTNTCQSLGICTQNQCPVSCEHDADADSYSVSCGDCNNNDAAVYPSMGEICDGIDNDCDNSIDEGLTRSCGTDVGICKAGYQICQNSIWQNCTNAIEPSIELCNNGFDEDCDWSVDEGCKCEPGAVQKCGEDIGECMSGLQLCQPNSQWGECIGELKQQGEICNGLDDDCDSLIDEELPDCLFLCGNDVCDKEEECDSCPYDCGECAQPEPGKGISFSLKVNSIKTRVFGVVELNAVIKNVAPKAMNNVRVKLDVPNGWQATSQYKFKKLSPREVKNVSFRFTVPYTKLERGAVRLKVNSSERHSYRVLPVFIEIPDFVVAPEPSLTGYAYEDRLVLNTLISNKGSKPLEDIEVEININRGKTTYIADMSKIYNVNPGEVFVEQGSYPLEYLGGKTYNIRGFLYHKGKKTGESNTAFDLTK